MIIVGLDFETANSERNSACQIGLVVLEDGREVDSFQSLIRPPGAFNPINVGIHGITAQRVLRAPTMQALWPTLQRYLLPGRRFFAHNAAFDRSVLDRSLTHHGLTPPGITLECTVDLARKRLPHLPDHKLPTVCDAVGVRLDRHHDALSDARASALIAWSLLSGKGGVAQPARPTAAAPIRRRPAAK
jgi:DNA polymerase-3 subunit epsilon